jgi:GMP synthase-like glutamine amidotransferase
MTEVLVIQNMSHEGVGQFAAPLRSTLGYDVVDLAKDDELPPLEDYKALVVLGGPDSANDPAQKMQDEVAYVREALQGDMPYSGICLGLQVGAKALGGEVVDAPQKEVGFGTAEGADYTVELTEAGVDDHLFYRIPTDFPCLSAAW